MKKFNNRKSKHEESGKSENVEKRKLIKKNQVVIGALTVLLGVAGYINFSGNSLDLAKGEAGLDKEDKTAESAFAETDVDVSAGELTIYDIENEENIELNSDEENIGEAVLASTDSVAVNAVNIKLNREQVRSKSKENYLEIINGDGMDEAAVEAATNAYIKMTDDMEKEAEAETLLMAKGFSDVMVSISEDAVDVVISAQEISDTDRAKIEDIVTRKTGCSVDRIIITAISK